MILYLLLLFILSTIGVRFSSFHEDYLSKDSTNGIKGIFAILILFSHMKGYLALSSDWYNAYYVSTLNHIDQMMVAPFLFYSGYGIMESFKRKPEYSKSFFTHRFLKILLHFDLAVSLFLIVQTPIGLVYPIRNYFTCWFAWDSIGNSNWFVFDILSLYIIAFTGMLLSRKFVKNTIPPSFALLFVTIIGTSFLFAILFIVQYGKPWWVNTLVTFPVGMLYSLSKAYIDKHFQEDKKLYWLCTIVVFIAFSLWYKFFRVDVFGVASVLFIFLLVFFTMKIQLNNPILEWLGVNAFAIYILQRLPMNVLKLSGVNDNVVFFSSLSIVLSLLIAWGFTCLLRIVDSRLYAKSEYKLTTKNGK